MAGGKKKNDYFWVSFSDLMTTLFFVMLVLFVLTVVYLKIEQAKTEATLEQFKKIVKLEEQFEPLQQDGDFFYLADCKKYVASDLMGEEIFEPEGLRVYFTNPKDYDYFVKEKKTVSPPDLPEVIRNQFL